MTLMKTVSKIPLAKTIVDQADVDEGATPPRFTYRSTRASTGQFVASRVDGTSTLSRMTVMCDEARKSPTQNGIWVPEETAALFSAQRFPIAEGTQPAPENEANKIAVKELRDPLLAEPRVRDAALGRHIQSQASSSKRRTPADNKPYNKSRKHKKRSAYPSSDYIVTPPKVLPRKSPKESSEKHKCAVPVENHLPTAAENHALPISVEEQIPNVVEKPDNGTIRRHATVVDVADMEAALPVSAEKHVAPASQEQISIPGDSAEPPPGCEGQIPDNIEKSLPEISQAPAPETAEQGISINVVTIYGRTYLPDDVAKYVTAVFDDICSWLGGFASRGSNPKFSYADRRVSAQIFDELIQKIDEFRALSANYAEEDAVSCDRNMVTIHGYHFRPIAAAQFTTAIFEALRAWFGELVMRSVSLDAKISPEEEKRYLEFANMVRMKIGELDGMSAQFCVKDTEGV